MKATKLFIYLLLALPAFFLQSCQTEEDNVFDKPYSERMGEFLQKAQDTLTASQYGWVLDYYPQSNQVYGGVAYTIKFTHDDAIVRYEKNPDDGEVKSLYKMKEDDGPVLSFDTYNAFLHKYATPKKGEYRGMEGDFEFVIDEIKADYIKVHGKRSLNTMYLRKLSEPATDYIEQVTDLTNLFVFSDFNLSIGGKSYTLVITDRDNRQLAIYDGNTPIAESAYTFTDRGIRLYEPITINGAVVYDLAFDKETAKLSGNGVQTTSSKIDVNVIANLIGTVDVSNGAKKIKKTIPYLSWLNVSCDASWVHLTKEGNTLTVDVDANAIATKARGAKIKISNGIDEASAAVMQYDLSALMGYYELKMTSYVVGDNNKDVLKVNTRQARLRYEGSGANRKFYLNVSSPYGDDFIFPLTYVASAKAFLMQSCQNVITLRNSRATYYIANSFNVDANRGTGTDTDFYNLITFSVNENGDISASLCGPLFVKVNGQLRYVNLTTERFILNAYSSEPFSDDNIVAMLDMWINPVITKKSSSSSSAKPAILPEETSDNTLSLQMPQYLPNRIPSFDVDFSSRLSPSVAKQVKLNK